MSGGRLQFGRKTQPFVESERNGLNLEKCRKDKVNKDKTERVNSFSFLEVDPRHSIISTLIKETTKSRVQSGQIPRT